MAKSIGSPYFHKSVAQAASTVISVKCSQCGNEAKFYFAIGVAIHKKDIPYFQKYKNFVCEKLSSVQLGGGNGYYAYFFPHLLESKVSSIKKLPAGYDPTQWEVSPQNFNFYFLSDIGKHKRLGTLVCSHCHYRAKHTLVWPQNAFFQWKIKKGNVLWAMDRKDAIALRNFIAEKNRLPNPKFDFLLPKAFKKKSVRDDIIKKIDRTLASTKENI